MVFDPWGLCVDLVLPWDSSLEYTDEIEPYVLAWPIGAEQDGEAECTVLVLKKRPGGLLLAMPLGFLPEALVEAGNQGGEETIFGPSFTCRVPAIIMDNGSVAPTGTEVEVRVIDCLVELVHSIRGYKDPPSADKIGHTIIPKKREKDPPQSLAKPPSTPPPDHPPGKAPPKFGWVVFSWISTTQSLGVQDPNKRPSRIKWDIIDVTLVFFGGGGSQCSISWGC